MKAEKLLRTSIRKAIFETLQERSSTAADETAPADKEQQVPKKPPKKLKDYGSYEEGSNIDYKIAAGGGRFSVEVTEQGAKAKKNPKGLMKELGITSSVGGATDLDKIHFVLAAVIKSNKIMASAYGMPSRRVVQTRASKVKDVVQIKAQTEARFGIKNAGKFIYHTLYAAETAGYLTLEGKAKIQGSGNELFIFIK